MISDRLFFPLIILCLSLSLSRISGKSHVSICKKLVNEVQNILSGKSHREKLLRNIFVRNEYDKRVRPGLENDENMANSVNISAAIVQIVDLVSIWSPLKCLSEIDGNVALKPPKGNVHSDKKF